MYHNSARLHVVPQSIYYSDNVSRVPSTDTIKLYLLSQHISAGDIVYFACFEKHYNNGCFVWNSKELEKLDYDSDQFGIIPDTFQVPYFDKNHWKDVLPFNDQYVRYQPPESFYNSLRWETTEMETYCWCFSYSHECYEFMIYVLDFNMKPLTYDKIRLASSKGIFLRCDNSRTVDDIIAATKGYQWSAQNCIELYLIF